MDIRDIQKEKVSTAKMAQFDGVVLDIAKAYQNDFKGKKLQILLEQSAGINARATFDMDDNPVISVTAGLLNHSLVDQDVLTMFICHELGHFLGGAPRKPRGNTGKLSWASAEGQADYYATAVCFKRLMKAEKNKNRAEQAALKMAKIYSITSPYSEPVSLNAKDEDITYITIVDHPGPQCRLDTMLAGLKCPESEKIPFDPENPNSGSCEAISNSYEEFARPKCWYASELFPF